jgi:hypothetical protein
MVAQIIISREDSTSFCSMGSVQDDASLVSALGGALANFAVEMGLSDSVTNEANFSQFQNGLLVTKRVNINSHSPSLMIAIRDFDDLKDYHHLFLIDYGSKLTEKVITSFEKTYTSEGAVPH